MYFPNQYKYDGIRLITASVTEVAGETRQKANSHQTTD